MHIRVLFGVAMAIGVSACASQTARPGSPGVPFIQRRSVDEYFWDFRAAVVLDQLSRGHIVFVGVGEQEDPPVDFLTRFDGRARALSEYEIDPDAMGR